MLSVRDLLNLAYDGFVLASSGRAILDYARGYEPSTKPEFWSERFMTAPTAAEVAKTGEAFPIFSLHSLGGITGVKRWINLDRNHPRATGPLVNKYRLGATGVEIRLIEIAAAMEYWTKVHRGLGRSWAQEIPKNSGSRRVAYKPLPVSMAMKAGPAFAEFVGGDIDKWCDAFWSTYNWLKHAPNYQYDTSAVRLLAESGEVLLLASLLARCTGNRRIVATICEDHRKHDVGYQLRQLLSSWPPS